MNLKFCFLTPEQEETLKAETKIYAAKDRTSLGLLTNDAYDLIHILEIYTLDHQGEIDDNQFLSMFHTLRHLMEPIYEYFLSTSGLSLEYPKNAGDGK